MTPTGRLPYLDDPRGLASERTAGSPPVAERAFSSPGGPVSAPGAAAPAAPGSSLPIDPLRLWWALRLGRWWLALGALGGLALGLGVGLVRMHTRYDSTFLLIKRYTPPTLQASAAGEPFKPRQFTNSTLASAATSFNVLQRVARRSRPPVTANQLKLAVNVKEDKLTDFLTATISGTYSAEATVALANLWSEEIINFTREIQSDESREIRKVIQGQLDSNQTELQQIDGELVKISGGQMLGADSQVDTFVRLQAGLDAQYDTARTELDGLTSQLAGFKSELMRHTPVAEELRQARADLSAFQARYTDKNPLVIERVEKIAALEARLKRQQDSGATMDLSDLSNHSGTAVGDQLYMRMVEMENQRAAAERRVQELGKQHDLLARSPEKVSQIMECLQRKQMLRTAQTMLLGRLQEVRIYEDNAPSFYGVFAPADIDHVAKTTKLFKVVILSVGGAAFGTFASLGLVLLLAVADPRLRAPGEAAKTVGAPLLASLAAGRSSASEDETTAAMLWTRWLTTQGEARRLRAVWCPGGHAGEDNFWRMMLAQAQRLLPGLLIIDGGANPCPALADLPEASSREWKLGPPFARVACPVAGSSLFEMRDLQYFIESRIIEDMEVWLRLDGLVREPAIGLLRATGSAPLVLASLHDSTTGGFLREQTELLRNVGLPPCGVVAMNT